MAALVWTFLFMLLSVAGSTIGLVAMIGMPIAPDIQSDVWALAVLVLGSGVVLAVGFWLGSSGDEEAVS
jgi:hypothetical protein